MQVIVLRRLISIEEEYAIARKVREVVTVGRVIVFGGTGNTMEDLWNAEEVKQGRFIGIASAKQEEVTLIIHEAMFYLNSLARKE